MVKKNKVSDLKGQHDRINSLDELFERFANRQLHSKITDGLSLNRCTEGGFHSPEMVKDPLSEMLREGVRLLIATAVRGELEDFMEQYKDRRLEDGRVAVVRNGYLPERDIQTGLGSVKVQIPKVRSKDGKPVVFHSALVPRYVLILIVAL